MLLLLLLSLTAHHALSHVVRLLQVSVKATGDRRVELDGGLLVDHLHAALDALVLLLLVGRRRACAILVRRGSPTRNARTAIHLVASSAAAHHIAVEGCPSLGLT